MRPEDFEQNEPSIPGIELKGGPGAWRPYAGKVVAVADGEVRAFGLTWSECLDAVKQAGISFESVEFLMVPRAAVIG